MVPRCSRRLGAALARVPADLLVGLDIADPEAAAVIEDSALGGSDGMIGRRSGRCRRISAVNIADMLAAAERKGREGNAPAC